MQIRLEEVAKQGGFSQQLLRARASNAPGGLGSYTLKATSDGVEVALVVLDIFPRSENVLLYELFVSPDYRRRGLGTALVSAVEDHARKLGRVEVRLLPRSLEPPLTDEQLAEWYTRLGYQPLDNGFGLYFKKV